jgi:hypothetical protein
MPYAEEEVAMSRWFYCRAFISFPVFVSATLLSVRRFWLLERRQGLPLLTIIFLSYLSASSSVLL